jgi:diadenosine tetraphosphate (Ap4A) HIT family hydrolase
MRVNSRTTATTQTTTPAATPPAQTTAPTTAATTAPTTTAADGDAFHAGRDMRTRVGVSAITAGPTMTAVPALLDDWKGALHKAAAEDLAEAEVIAPVLTPALQAAEAKKGEPLTRKEFREINREVFKAKKPEYKAAVDAHFKDLTRSPSAKKQTEMDVLLTQRQRVDGLKDVFAAVAQKLPGARDNEIVLWENKNAMVLVDTFAPSPKALVVPKTPVSLPTDAPKALLDELAVIAAHVSDAFMRAANTPAAGIWINPPQHLTVKQMHIHVLPDMGQFTEDGAPAKAFLEDPQFRRKIEAYFQVIANEIAAKLGQAS